MALIQINQNVLAEYNRELISVYIPENERRHYVKWLRYYLDFCNKYKLEFSENIFDLISVGYIAPHFNGMNISESILLIISVC